jgi:hypothetical protein
MEVIPFTHVEGELQQDMQRLLPPLVVARISLRKIRPEAAVAAASSGRGKAAATLSLALAMILLLLLLAAAPSSSPTPSSTSADALNNNNNNINNNNKAPPLLPLLLQDDVPSCFGGECVRALLSAGGGANNPRSPASSSPLLALIPKVVHMTVEDRARVPCHMLDTMRTWRDLNPGYRVWVWGAADRRRLVSESFSAWLPYYDSLAEGVERADLFKYAVLSALGGVYADVDAECRVPIDEWAAAAAEGRGGYAGLLLGGSGNGSSSTVGRSPKTPPLTSALIVGVEAVHDDPDTYHIAKHIYPVQLSAWTIAASPGHPALGPPGQALFPASQREAARQLAALFGGGGGGEECGVGGNSGRGGTLPVIEALGLGGVRQEGLAVKRGGGRRRRHRSRPPPLDDFEEGAFEEEEEEEEQQRRLRDEVGGVEVDEEAAAATAAAAASHAEQAARLWYRESILNRTGPFLLTREALRFARDPLLEPRPLRVDSHLDAVRLLRGGGGGYEGGYAGVSTDEARRRHALAILPLAAFGAGQPHSQAPPVDAPGVLVVHKFLSSWRGSGDGQVEGYWCAWEDDEEEEKEKEAG